MQQCFVQERAGLANTVEFFDEPSQHMGSGGLNDLCDLLADRANAGLFIRRPALGARADCGRELAMGLITGLLTLPLAPVRGVAWVAEQVADEAERELYDEQRIMRELAELEASRDEGLIGQEAFERGVDELLWRLELGRQRQLERQG